MSALPPPDRPGRLIAVQPSFMMNTLTNELGELIQGRLCLLGFGNRMWSDDGAGSVLAEWMEGCPGLDSIDAGMTPENHLEKVVKRKPGTVLLLDAADFGGSPGETRLLRAEHLVLSGISTHAGSPQMLASYLEARTGAKVALLAIQPKNTGEGGELSPEVSATLKDLAETLRNL